MDALEIIVAVAIAVLSLYVGYVLGERSQKKQRLLDEYKSVVQPLKSLLDAASAKAAEIKTNYEKSKQEGQIMAMFGQTEFLTAIGLFANGELHHLDDFYKRKQQEGNLPDDLPVQFTLDGQLNKIIWDTIECARRSSSVTIPSDTQEQEATIWLNELTAAFAKADDAIQKRYGDLDK
jgi:hypothetical protein